MECPTCELRGLLRILKLGGVFVGTWYAPSVYDIHIWKENDIYNQLQIFGAVEFGNTVEAAGFVLEKCWADVTQWPEGFMKLFDRVGLEEFDRQSLVYSASHEKLVTTYCVAHKPPSPK